uniref:Ribosomal protein S2 n=1 Tax=Rhexinema sarcinoideum TaxID=43261 RepID=A0A1B2RYW4_9CHLO|nr:ribosomal protein S2 [Rhexinema sarcinoideum]
MTHTLCQHLVNTYCLNEYCKNLKQCEKKPEKVQLRSFFFDRTLKFCTSFSLLPLQKQRAKQLLFLQKRKPANILNKFKSRNVKSKTLRLKPSSCDKNWQSRKEKNEKHQAHSFQRFKYTEQLASHLNQSSPLWATLYFSRHDLAFLNLRSLCSSLLKALHACLFATLNNKRILFVGDPRPLVKEHQHQYQHFFICSQVKSLSTHMTNQLPPLFQYLQKKSNFHSFFQLLQQNPRALWPPQLSAKKQAFPSQENFSNPLKIVTTKETCFQIEKPKTFSPQPQPQPAACSKKTSLEYNPRVLKTLTIKVKARGQDEKKECKHSFKKRSQLYSNFYCFNNMQELANFSKASLPFAFAKAKVETQLQKHLKRKNLFTLENQALTGQTNKTLGPLSTQTKQDSFKNSLELAVHSKNSAHSKFKQSPSKFSKKQVTLENSTFSLTLQNFKKHHTLQTKAVKTWEPYDKAKTKLSAQKNEGDFFYMALTKLACKAALRNSQWTAAFAQADKGWKGGFFSNSLLSYKQNLTFSSKLNIQRVDDKDWFSLEIPFSSKLNLLDFSSSLPLGKDKRPEAGSCWNPIYLPAPKKKRVKKVENLNEFQTFKTKLQVPSKQSLLNFSGQIPAAKKLFKKSQPAALRLRPQGFGLRSFAFKKILTQVAKTEKTHFSLNPWLKEADLVFFANPEKSTALLSQVNRLKIPSIGIVNSGENLSFPFRSVKGSSLLSSNPTLTYPIIGNSNSLNFINMVYAKLIGVLNKKVKLLRFKS